MGPICGLGFSRERRVRAADLAEREAENHDVVSLRQASLELDGDY
jgi:hypothetical protein